LYSTAKRRCSDNGHPKPWMLFHNRSTTCVTGAGGKRSPPGLAVHVSSRSVHCSSPSTTTPQYLNVNEDPRLYLRSWWNRVLLLRLAAAPSERNRGRVCVSSLLVSLPKGSSAMNTTARYVILVVVVIVCDYLCLQLYNAHHPSSLAFTRSSVSHTRITAVQPRFLTSARSCQARTRRHQKMFLKSITSRPRPMEISP
jgi:hypothetical protein